MTTETAQTTQVYQVSIRATPERIWEAITIVGWSRWESREAFEALGMQRPPEGSPPPAGERAPRRRFYLDLV